MAVSNPFFCLVNAAVSAQTSSQSVADRVNRLNPHSRERRDDAAQGPDARGDGDARNGCSSWEGRGVAQGDVERLQRQESDDDDRDTHSDDAGNEGRNDRFHKHRKEDARRVVVREHSRHIEGALRLGDADDAHRDAVARMQDDRHLIDRGAAQLVPQAFGDDDGNQALVGITALDPASREHTSAVDDRIGGVHTLERDAVDHVADLRQGIAAELSTGPSLAGFDDVTTPAGKARPGSD